VSVLRHTEQFALITSQLEMALRVTLNSFNRRLARYSVSRRLRSIFRIFEIEIEIGHLFSFLYFRGTEGECIPIRFENPRESRSRISIARGLLDLYATRHTR